MSQLTKLILKTGVVALVLWGGYKWVNQTPERAETTASTTNTIVEKTLDKTDLMLDKSGEVVDEAMIAVSDAWDRADLKGDVDTLQDEVKPLGDAIKKRIDPNKVPGGKVANGKVSIPALLLFLIAGITLSLMAFAGPSSLSGGRN